MSLKKSHPDIRIRLAMHDEASIVSQVLYDAFREFEPLYTHDGFLATTPEPKNVTARMQEGPVWVACREAEVIGTVAAVQQTESVNVRGMAVLPSARGLHVGASLLDHLENWALEQGCSRLYLSTTRFLSAAIRLYERSGFRKVNGSDHDLSGTPLFTMEKEIARSA